MDHLHNWAWVAWAFNASNAVRALFYVPQIVVLARSDDTRSVSLCTWCFWLVNNGLGAMCSALVLHQPALAASFVACWIGCACVVGLTLLKRRRRPGEPLSAAR